ncbi:aldehyde dehydrogenase family protein, partial [Pseudomonas sp. Pseusp97]|uniref:aldehyde dehydrogenase family protein n=1 Tax=Pseudomonas sp. Pseusp97 TaxID=3243065 RepID=UPI0039A56EF2
MRTDRHFIDGRFADASSAHIAVFDPATEQQVAQVPAATEADVRNAVEAAARAQRS